MKIQKIVIENFKCYKDKFTLKLNEGVNILVGNNEAGKSTILEAIHLALSGMMSGRYIQKELSQYLFNKEIERSYIANMEKGQPSPPPSILIEIFFDSAPSLAILRGNNNSDNTDNCGVSFRIEFDNQYQSEYEELVKGGGIKTIPIEYYKITLKSFARTGVTPGRIPIKSALIDSSSARTQNVSDVYISKIIRESLDDKEKVEISQAHRQMKEVFMETPSVKAINTKINTSANITDKEVTISVDLSTQNAWEMSLMTYLDEIPFHYIGKGEQSIIKTNLALSHKKSQEANIILFEEPENHLSHSKLAELIKNIITHIDDKQIIVSTHSSFVANKLGLNHLILLNDLKNTRLSELSKETQSFFSKLSGYDTLRLILCKKSILVEGDSDELIVQKAYKVKNGKLPIEDGIDVISVGTSFLRFLEIAEKINKTVIVVTDNDSKIDALKKKYINYIDQNKKSNITICFDKEIDTGEDPKFNYNTLEPKLLKTNGIDKFNKIFGTSYTNDDMMHKYMENNKTDCALKIFNSEEKLCFPTYILDAIE